MPESPEAREFKRQMYLKASGAKDIGGGALSLAEGLSPSGPRGRR